MRRILLLVLVLLMGASMAYAENGGMYALGDRVEDFALTLADGREVRLYELLEEKDVVLLNIWATFCPPCREEMPHLQAAYEQLSERAEILAITAYPPDTDEAIRAFKAEIGLTTLPMGFDTAGISPRFDTDYIPTQIIIDRFGTLCYMEPYIFGSAQEVVDLLGGYIGEDYSESKLLGTLLPYALFSVRYTDEEGLPVAGVLTQICSPEQCGAFESDAFGAIDVYGDFYPYDLHVLSAPEGYKLPDRDYVFPEAGGTISIVLEKE